jgi:hypothetical protein
MAKSLWDERARAELLRRVERLDPETPARWGRMNAGEMLAHVVAGLRLSLGEIETRPRRSVFRHWPLKHLFIYWVPFPRSAPAPREIVTRGKHPQWDANLAALHHSIDRLVTRNRHDPWPDHPVFGQLSPRAWGALGWRHMDHHLRQFGL